MQHPQRPKLQTKVLNKTYPQPTPISTMHQSPTIGKLQAFDRSIDRAAKRTFIWPVGVGVFLTIMRRFLPFIPHFATTFACQRSASDAQNTAEPLRRSRNLVKSICSSDRQNKGTNVSSRKRMNNGNEMQRGIIRDAERAYEQKQNQNERKGEKSNVQLVHLSHVCPPGRCKSCAKFYAKSKLKSLHEVG